MVSEWNGRVIDTQDRVDRIGQILGMSTPRRVLPPHDDAANIAVEFQQQKPHLWMFSSTGESATSADIPILLRNTRLTSQHALIAFAKFAADYFKIEAVGVLTWKETHVTCDPVAWRLFY